MTGTRERLLLGGVWTALVVLVPALVVTIVVGLGDRPVHQAMPDAELTSVEFGALPG